MVNVIHVWFDILDWHGFQIRAIGVAFGTTGRNPKEKGKTLFDWALTKTMPMHGAEREKVAGQLLKVQFWEQPLH